MGKSNLFILMLAVLGSANATTSTFENRCRHELPQANVMVEAQTNGYKVLNNVSARILSEKGVHNYSTELLMGLTDLNSVIEIYFDGQILSDLHADQECLAPRIDVILRYKQMNVFVAREFSEFSCSYQVMLDHEMRHVQIYQQQLPLVQERVRLAMENRFAQGPMMATYGKAKDVLDKELDTVWLPYIRAELNKVEILQQAFDSKEEEFRLSNSCFGQTSRLMGGSFY